MGRSVLAAVLALLMLMPPGMCVCGGGARICPDHPTAKYALDLPGSQPDGGEDSCCRPARVENARAEHHCPAPIPHEPSCPVVSPVSTQAAAKIVPSVVIVGFVEPVLVSLSFVPPPCPLAPITIHVSTPPRFIAHCALLI